MKRTCTACRKTSYSNTLKGNRCPFDGKTTRLDRGYTAVETIRQKDVRSKEQTRPFAGLLGRCTSHGWACRVMEDHSMRK